MDTNRNETDTKAGSDLKPLNFFNSLILFAIPSGAFLLITLWLIPLLRQKTGIHPALAWFAGGSFLFAGLFVAALLLCRRDGYRSLRAMRSRMRFVRMSSRDWKWSFGGLLLVFVLSGLIMAVSQWLHNRYGLPLIDPTPDFLAFEPFQGRERWLLAAWFFMFFFNMMGEEMLWRGYILPRQEMYFGTPAWWINSALWMVFHICFGLSLMILLVPVMLVLPYVVHKTQNTWTGVFIHAVFNGPMFVLVSLGVIQ